MIKRSLHSYFLSIFFLFLSLAFLITKGYAGWPEDGWEGVSSLNISHKGQIIDFDNIHQLLSKEEENVARALPSDNKTNIVLASISFLGGGDTPSLYTYHLKNQGKQIVFESGLTSSFTHSPVYEEAQRLLRPYASKLQKEDGLSFSEKETLVRDCFLVCDHQRYFVEQVAPKFHFFHQESIPIDFILRRVERVFSGISEINELTPSLPIYTEFTKDKAAFNRISIALQANKVEAGQNIIALSDQVKQNPEVSLDFIREAASSLKADGEKVSKREIELNKVGSKVISTYWHSEPKLLSFIEENNQMIAEDIMQNLPFIPESIFINMHSRHDICSVCGHSLVCSYTHPNGILNIFKNAFCEKLKIDPQTFPLYVTSSFREERTKSRFKLTKSLHNLESLHSIFPAFPTLYVPSSAPSNREVVATSSST